MSHVPHKSCGRHSPSWQWRPTMCSGCELTVDPYGVWPEPPEEYQQVGREYFARSPGSEVWVHFSDLPEATRDALWKKHRRKLAFPAGLEALFTAEERRQSVEVVDE
jgi:hypothetical protein